MPEDTAPQRERIRGIVDREEDVLRDPRDGTWLRLGALRLLTRRYAELHGKLPARIEELAPPGSEHARYRTDAWGEEIVYLRRGKVYEFRSPGPDRRLFTHDDLVIDKATVIPGPHQPGS